MTNGKLVETNADPYLENIIALMPGHVYWKNRQGVLLGCNDEQAKSLGLKSRQDIVGLTAHDTLPKEFADEVVRNDELIMSTGIAQMLEEVLTQPDGEKSIWLSKKVPLRNSAGEVIGILGVSFDITEKKQIEQELQEAKHKLEGMTQVSAIIAHELRTPLAALNIARDNLQEIFPHLKAAYLWAQERQAPLEIISPAYFNFIGEIFASMQKEIKAAFTFIDMSLMNTTSTLDGMKLERFSISECINEALTRYPFSQGQRSLVKWSLASNLDFLVKGDKLLLVHVLFNLLKNSLYYIAKAGKGEISIYLAPSSTHNTLFFKDTATGIAADILPHIFERFFTQTYHGAGIGLSFCKMVMEALGGQITCESIKGDYTLFILHFPSTIE